MIGGAIARFDLPSFSPSPNNTLAVPGLAGAAVRAAFLSGLGECARNIIRSAALLSSSPGSGVTALRPALRGGSGGEWAKDEERGRGGVVGIGREME